MAWDRSRAASQVASTGGSWLPHQKLFFLARHTIQSGQGTASSIGTSSAWPYRLAYVFIAWCWWLCSAATSPQIDRGLDRLPVDTGWTAVSRSNPALSSTGGLACTILGCSRLSCSSDVGVSEQQMAPLQIRMVGSSPLLVALGLILVSCLCPSACFRSSRWLRWDDSTLGQSEATRRLLARLSLYTMRFGTTTQVSAKHMCYMCFPHLLQYLIVV